LSRASHRTSRRSAFALSATAVVALALVAGCTTGEESEVRASDEPSAATTHDPPGPQAGPTIPADDPITKELLPPDTPSGEWTLAVDPTTSDTTVSVWATLYCRHELDRILVHETPETVTLAAAHRRLDDPTGDSECPAVEAHQPVDVELDEPIGDRQLQHVEVTSDLN
jgi:hypothetical protein